MRVALLIRAVLVALAVPLGAATGDAAAKAPKRLAVGAATLTRCADDPAFACGTLRRPLDPAKPGGRRIRIAFRWRPADRGGKRSGPPLVAVEGGPGYPSTGSSVEYLGILGPLLRTRDLLLVDNRGTGGSALLRCPTLQRFTGQTGGPAYAARVAACARAIDRRFGPGAHARFGTADAVDDLAAVLRRLRLPPVALYGDSYGSFFAQSFLARHPARLDSVVLDSTYPAQDLDPFYASSGATARDALDAVCARDAGCAAATAGLRDAPVPSGTGPAEGPRPEPLAATATGRLRQLAERLRRTPLTGRTRDADGARATVRVIPTTLADLVQWAGSDPTVYRELDPAVRAALQGDAAPLLRLVAQATSWNAGGSPASYFSDGAYMAVSCVDYPQLWDRAATPAARREQLAAAVAAGPQDAFAPFALPEWLAISAYSQPYQACLDWPASPGVRPPVPDDAQPLPASVPLLVVGGDLDSLTPLRDARELAPRLATRSRVVELPNTVHVTSEGDTPLVEGAACARRVIRAFLRVPGRIDDVDAGCAAAIPPVNTAGAFPRTLADAVPATLRSGTDPGEDARRAVTVAAGALGDAVARRVYRAEDGVVPGLRGGDVVTTGDRVVRLRFRRTRFAGDVVVTGTGRWRPATGAVDGRLRVTDELGATTRVTIAWAQRDRLAGARVPGATLAVPAP